MALKKIQFYLLRDFVRLLQSFSFKEAVPCSFLAAVGGT